MLYISLRNLLAAPIAALALSCALPANASVIVGGTRVVYRAADKEVTLKLTNEGQSPALTQAWVDAGTATPTPTSIEVPFTITPPIARIDPGKGQTLRILYTGEPLPQDKESLFWLNVLEIPPKPSADEAGVNSLQMAFRSRFKLFFRPAGLPGSATEAPAALRWELGSRDGKPVLLAHNPTPYHVSPVSVEVIAGEHLAKATDPDMIAPGATATFHLDSEVRNPAGATVRVHCINDFGGRDKFGAPLNASGSR